MNNHIIKIQRYYRTHLIKRKLYILKQYNLKNKNEIIFDNFTKIIRGVDIIKATKNVINIFNSIYKPIINITPHVILTAYLINNFPQLEKIKKDTKTQFKKDLKSYKINSKNISRTTTLYSCIPNEKLKSKKKRVFFVKLFFCSTSRRVPPGKQI